MAIATIRGRPTTPKAILYHSTVPHRALGTDLGFCVMRRATDCHRDIKPREAMKEGTFSLTWMMPSARPEARPNARETAMAARLVRRGLLKLSWKASIRWM